MSDNEVDDDEGTGKFEELLKGTTERSKEAQRHETSNNETMDQFGFSHSLNNPQHPTDQPTDLVIDLLRADPSLNDTVEDIN